MDKYFAYWWLSYWLHVSSIPYHLTRSIQLWWKYFSFFWSCYFAFHHFHMKNNFFLEDYQIANCADDTTPCSAAKISELVVKNLYLFSNTARLFLTFYFRFNNFITDICTAYISRYYTAQRMKFSIKDFFSKCDQVRRLQIEIGRQDLK